MDREKDGGVIFPVFNGADRLAGYPHCCGECVLADAVFFSKAGNFVFHIKRSSFLLWFHDVVYIFYTIFCHMTRLFLKFYSKYYLKKIQNSKMDRIKQIEAVFENRFSFFAVIKHQKRNIGKREPDVGKAFTAYNAE